MPQYQIRAVIEARNVEDARLKAKQVFQSSPALKPDGDAFGVVSVELSCIDTSAEDELMACPDCGCTDIECTAWVNVNGDEVSSSDPPNDTVWCPQCSYNGDEGTMKYRFLITVSKAKPVCFDEEAVGG